ncbi:MAG TPA: hypothetical protein VFU89_00665 [Rhabdochlamydiaceae bacterium]|nr:hypothetical protein [Rhabdochlamydiaceae bacterium]
MTEQVTYWRSIYALPNAEEDLRRNSPLIYLGTHTKALTTAGVNLASIRKAVIKSNFQAKTQIAQLGETLCISKPASKRYEWEVIVGTITTLFGKFVPAILTLFFLVIILPWMLKAGFSPWKNKISLILTALYTILFSILIKYIQKPYIDGYVLFQCVSYIPNSMSGFDPNQLANNKREDGWDDPITLENIPSDQITSSQILRIGKYASSIIPVLQRMLTADYTTCPEGEIPHPYEPRSLSPDEKTKFLLEVSAFFSIPSKALENCWSVRVEDDDIAPYVDQIKYWFFFPNLLKHRAAVALTEQLRPIKRKQAFLKLLTDSIAQQYFSKEFRCSDVSIPTFTPQQIQDARTQEIGNIIEEVRLFTTFQVLRETGALDALLAFPNAPPTPTSGQSGNAGPP